MSDAVLRAFARAAGREAHTLSGAPSLLWQQMFNRLQWEGDSVRTLLDEERRRREEPGRPAWMRLRTPFRESVSLRGVMEAHDAAVRRIAPCPDGLVVTVGSDGLLQSWDPTDGRRVRAIAQAADAMVDVSVGLDGAFLVWASNGELMSWDLRADAPSQAVGGETVYAQACAVAPACDYVIVGYREGTVALWDVGRKEIAGFPRRHADEVTRCAVSPDGTLAVSASVDRTLKVWDVERMQELGTLDGHAAAVTSCAIAPGGSPLVSSSDDKTLKVWDLPAGTLRATLTGHTARVSDCAVSPDGAFAVSAGWDGTVRVWDLNAGTEIAALAGHGAGVRTCAVAPDASTIVSGDIDGVLRVWDVPTAAEPPPPAGHDGGINSCAFDATGARAITAGDDRVVKLWEVGSLSSRLLRTFAGHADAVSACDIGPDGEWLVSTSFDRTLKVWDVDSGKERAGEADDAPGSACRIASDGSSVVWCTTKTTWVLDAATLHVRAHFGDHSGAGCDVSPDGTFLLTAGDDVTTWDLATGSMRYTIPQGPNHSCAISPDGELLLVGGRDGSVSMWRAADGQPVIQLTAHRGWVGACAFTPDGGHFLTAGEEGVVRLWRTEGPELVATLPLPGGEARCLDVHPSEPVALCGDAGGTLHVIELVATGVPKAVPQRGVSDRGSRRRRRFPGFGHRS